LTFTGTILAAAALSNGSARGVALVLAALGLGALAVEALHPGIGLAGITGALALIGSLVLFSTTPGAHLPVAWVIAAAAVLAAFAALVTPKVVAARRRRHLHQPPATLVGETALVERALRPEGVVRARGESWTARSSAPAEAGAQVRVTAVRGLSLDVEPIAVLKGEE
jgi:membrane-bound serine protease (ClpP class)